ncbi:methyltransferase domain-containing protein [Flocculibacter collagenilyticus]|uniref:methyltransferase domain-containing protein n=1 Tax=Flocculibacter collagenilyticus TaxID=2744479 RepID=UPI0018F422AE|nr:methyltransferase domain-containing protein [Flocculibacter collagenilyticus]
MLNQTKPKLTESCTSLLQAEESAFNKRKVERAFEHGVATYEQANTVQRVSAEKLLAQLLKANTSKHKANVLLDLGCGKGVNTVSLERHCETLLSADITYSALRNIDNKINKQHLLNTDAESLPLQSNTIDLVYSNLMLQWTNNPQHALNELVRVLTHGGRAHVSTLIDGSLNELKYAWSKVDNDKHVNYFITRDELTYLINALPNVDVSVSFSTEQVYGDTVKQLCTDLKKIGANYVSGRKNTALMGKSKWKKMCLAYEKFRIDGTENTASAVHNKLPLTYQIAYIEMVKRD